MLLTITRIATAQEGYWDVIVDLHILIDLNFDVEIWNSTMKDRSSNQAWLISPSIDTALSALDDVLIPLREAFCEIEPLVGFQRRMSSAISPRLLPYLIVTSVVALTLYALFPSAPVNLDTRLTIFKASFWKEQCLHCLFLNAKEVSHCRVYNINWPKLYSLDTDIALSLFSISRWSLNRCNVDGRREKNKYKKVRTQGPLLVTVACMQRWLPVQTYRDARKVLVGSDFHRPWLDRYR